jgi:hypothetical protein
MISALFVPQERAGQHILDGQPPVTEFRFICVTGREGRMETWLQWGLVYLGAIVVMLAIFSPRKEPWSRLKQLLQMIVGIFKS